MQTCNEWHYKLRELPPVVLIGIIETLEKKYNCADDICKKIKEVTEIDYEHRKRI